MKIDFLEQTTEHPREDIKEFAKALNKIVQEKDIPFVGAVMNQDDDGFYVVNSNSLCSADFLRGALCLIAYVNGFILKNQMNVRDKIIIENLNEICESLGGLVLFAEGLKDEVMKEKSESIQH